MSEEVLNVPANVSNEEPIGDAETKTIVEDPNTGKKYQVKVDGEVLEVAEDELLKGYQLSKASHKRFQEAAEKLKSVDELFAIGKQDPTQVLKALGVDPVEWMSEYVDRLVEENSLTPEQKEMRELKAYKERMDKEAAEKQRLLKEEQAKAQAQAEAQKIDSEISQAFKEAGIKPNARLIQRMADYMLADLAAGNKEIDARKALARTQNDIQAELMDLLSLEPDKYLSKADAAKRENLRKYFMRNVADVDDDVTESPQKEQAVGNKGKNKSGIKVNEFFKGVHGL